MINKIIPYSCNITSLFSTFDTVLSDFCILSLNLESQTDIMKKIIPYSCNIPSLLLHFDTVLSNLVFRVSMKSQIDRINKIIPYSCNITSLLHTFDTVLSDFHFLSLNFQQNTRLRLRREAQALVIV